MKWTLIALGVLAAAVIALAVAGVGKRDKGSAKAVSGSTSATGTGLGSRAHPIPLGTAAAIGYGWRLRVLSAVPNADHLVVGYRKGYDTPNAAPPPGAQDYLVRIALTYAGGGKDDATLVIDYGIRAMGAHNARYDPSKDGCGSDLPPPTFTSLRQDVFSGQTVRGNLCFQIAKNDARTLLLNSGNNDALAKAVLGVTKFKNVWFALRPR